MHHGCEVSARIGLKTNRELVRSEEVLGKIDTLSLLLYHFRPLITTNGRNVRPRNKYPPLTTL